MTDDAPSADGESIPRSVTRRQALGAGGAALTLALAGCAAEDGEGSGNVTDAGGGGQTALSAPSPPPVPDDQYWAYVVRSLEYQNAALQSLLEAQEG